MTKTDKEVLLSDMRRWKQFLEPLDAEHKKLMWKALLEKNPNFTSLLK